MWIADGFPCWAPAAECVEQITKDLDRIEYDALYLDSLNKNKDNVGSIDNNVTE